MKAKWKDTSECDKEIWQHCKYKDWDSVPLTENNANYQKKNQFWIEIFLIEKENWRLEEMKSYFNLSLDECLQCCLRGEGFGA